jgi:hypothetical protein
MPSSTDSDLGIADPGEAFERHVLAADLLPHRDILQIAESGGRRRYDRRVAANTERLGADTGANQGNPVHVEREQPGQIVPYQHFYRWC